MRAWFVLLLACSSEPPAPPRPAPTPVFMLGDLASEFEDACVAPLLADMMARPNWSLRVDERHWSDVVDNDPDELASSITVDAGGGAEWTDPAYHERLPVDAKPILAALALSCRRPDDAPVGLGGRRYEFAYGAGSPGMVLISEWSPAGLALTAAMDAARTAYNATRLADARAATLVLRGERYEQDRWTHVTITARAGTLTIEPESFGDAKLRDEDMIQVLDWASPLSANHPGNRGVLFGTINAHHISADLGDLGDPVTRKHYATNVVLDRLLDILTRHP